MFLALALSALLAQSDATPAPTVPGEVSPAERSALAAEKAALAAEKAAEAALRIANAVAPLPAEAAKAEPTKDGWKGNFGLGFTFITGNSQILTLTGSSSIDRKWEVWAVGIRLSGAYGLSNPDNSPIAPITARRASGTIRADRSVGSGFASLFALAGSEFDHMKNVESRSIGELGAGLTFFQKKEADFEKLYLRLDLAMRAGYETRFQYFPTPAPVDVYGIIILAPRIAATFRWSFNKDVRLTEELEFIPFLLSPTLGRLLINNNTKLSAKLTEGLSLTTSVLVNFDSMPPRAGALDRKTTDVALTVGLDANF